MKLSDAAGWGRGVARGRRSAAVVPGHTLDTAARSDGRLGLRQLRKPSLATPGELRLGSGSIIASDAVRKDGQQIGSPPMALQLSRDFSAVRVRFT